MNIVTPNSIDEILKEFDKHMYNSIFRGHRDSNYALTTSLKRLFDKGSPGPDRALYEFNMFMNFKYKSYPMLKYAPNDDWEFLTLMQHHGAATRLMDWTNFPLVATYFAIFQNDNSFLFFRKNNFEEACVWALNINQFVAHNKFLKGIPADPTALPPFRKYIHGKSNESYLFMPRHWSLRANSQGGRFLIHGDIEQPLERSVYTNALTKIIIQRQFVADLLQLCFTSGINTARLFPDIDGLAYATNEGMFFMGPV